MQFPLFGTKSDEFIVWPLNLPKRWDCPTIIGTEFLEIPVVALKTMPLKFVSPRLRVQLHFINVKINKIFQQNNINYTDRTPHKQYKYYNKVIYHAI